MLERQGDLSTSEQLNDLSCFVLLIALKFPELSTSSLIIKMNNSEGDLEKFLNTEIVHNGRYYNTILEYVESHC